MKALRKSPLFRLLAALLLISTLTVAPFQPPYAVARNYGSQGQPQGESVPAAPTSGRLDTLPSTGVESIPRFGLEVSSFSDEASMSALVDSGAKMVRIEISWASIEPANVDPELYRWSGLDSTLSLLSANNLAPLVVVKDCPSWACVRDIGPLLGNREADAAQFMGALAARYSVAPYRTHYWEMWNEPDAAGGPGNQWGWGMHGDKYAQMLSYVYPAVKAADPASVLLLGGIAYDNFFSQGGPFNPDFLPDVLDNGGAQYLDGVAFHYYVQNAHDWTQVGIKANVLRALLDEHGAGHLPLLCTEAGQTSDPAFGSSEAIQARYLVQMNVHGAASGLLAQVWFLNRDFTSPDPWMQIFTKFGITRVNGTRKPSHTAMSVLAREVGSGAYIRRLGANDGVVGTLEGYRFRMGHRPGEVSVVWNNAEAATTLTVPAGDAPELARAVGISGQEVPITQGPDGTRLVSVGQDPVYLEWPRRFDDVLYSSWMYEYVEYLASRGVIGGYSDGNFRPGNPATRGQFSKMAVLGMGWPLVNPSVGHFVDVAQDNTFYQYVETAFSRGIIGGYPCGGEGEPCPGAYFRPGNNITRGQIAKIIVLAKGWPLLDPATPTFTDVPRDSVFYSYVETSVAHGIVSGYSDQTFRPGNNATRAQLSKMLALALQQSARR